MSILLEWPKKNTKLIRLADYLVALSVELLSKSETYYVLRHTDSFLGRGSCNILIGKYIYVFMEVHLNVYRNFLHLGPVAYWRTDVVRRKPIIDYAAARPFISSGYKWLASD